MNIEGITQFMQPPVMQSIEYSHKTTPTFTSWLTQQVMETNQQLQAADQALTDLATGQAQNLHATMLTLEQAKLSLQCLEQIRNRLLTAYQELLREQI